MNRDIARSDPELLDALGGDRELLALARHAREGRPEAPMGPNFQAYLRTRLMDAAPRHLRPGPLLRLRRALRPAGVVGVGTLALAGAGMAAIALVTVAHAPSGGGGARYAIVPQLSIRAGASDVDPQAAITIAFNQPMDHTSVEHAIRISPATAFTVHWDDRTNTASIVATHALSANTAYVVSLQPGVARSAAGQALTTPLSIPFGTRPVAATAPPAPGPAPLPVTALGRAMPGTGLVGDGGGGAFAAAGTAVAGATPSAAPTPSGAASATTAGSSPSAAIATAGAGVLHLGPAAGQVATTPAALAVAVSPAGRSLAVLRGADGDPAHEALTVSALDGSHPRTLVRAVDAGSPLAWLPSGILVTVDGGHPRLVDLAGGIRDAGLPALGPAVPLLVVRDGGHAVVLAAPAGPSASATPTPTTSPTAVATASVSPPTSASAPASLSPAAVASGSPGAPPAGTPAAPPAGAVVADLGGATAAIPGPLAALAVGDDGARLVTSSAAAVALTEYTLPATLTATLPPGTAVDPGAGVTAVTALALDPSGALALTATTAKGTETRGLDAAGHLVGRGPALTPLVALGGGRVAGITAPAAPGADADVVALTITAAPPASSRPTVAAAAAALLDRLVSAQAPRDDAALRGLPVAGAPAIDPVAAVPAGVTQADAVTATPAADGRSVDALVRLVSIPTTGTTVLTTDEHATLARQADGTWAITALAVGALTPESTGPHVRHVDIGGTAAAPVVVIAVDGDLDPASVAGAVTLSDGSHPSAVYDPGARTITVTLAAPPLADGVTPATRSVVLGTSLRDVDGQALAAPVTVPLPG